MKVAVIGAGASGLPAIKTCLEYGMVVVAFEQSNDIGGLWRYKPESCPGQGSVMKSTVINTSKEMTAFSDLPPPAHSANYMHNSAVLDYLNMYTNRFDLRRHIRFEHRVSVIRRADDYEQSGQWLIEYLDLRTGETGSEQFNAVMLATGHHTEPHWPSAFPGMDAFKGRILHSHDYKDTRGFEDKRVLVVGIGNSGGDIAVELSKTASQVFLSTRTGTWITFRLEARGEPSDLYYLNRCQYFMKSLLPRSLVNRVLEEKVNQRFDHGRFGLRPAHRFLDAHVTINDELPNRIVSGTVMVKPNIVRFDAQRDVHFDDGTIAPSIDSVIFATGYSFGFPLLEHGTLIPVVDNRVDGLLYKNMYPVHLSSHNTLAVIGLVQPTGSIMPISEMQARLFCHNLAGNRCVPGAQEMLNDIALKQRGNNHFVKSRRHTIQVEYVEYMDELAELIGCRPRMLKFWLSDAQLAHRLVFHGLVPYQYRLTGPHKWSGAREAILGVEQRVFEVTRTRRTPETLKAKPVSKLYSAHLVRSVLK